MAAIRIKTISSSNSAFDIYNNSAFNMYNNSVFDIYNNSIINGEDIIINSYETKHNDGCIPSLNYSNQCMWISILQIINKYIDPKTTINDIRNIASNNNIQINNTRDMFDTERDIKGLKQVLNHYDINLYIYTITNNNNCIKSYINSNKYLINTFHIIYNNSHFELMTNINGKKLYDKMIGDKIYNYSDLDKKYDCVKLDNNIIYSVNDITCSVNDITCSVNDITCSVNDITCSVNDTTCSVNDITCSVNDTSSSDKLEQLLIDKKSYITLLSHKTFELEAENYQYINHLSNDPNDEALNKIITDTHNNFIDTLKLELSELSKSLKKINDNITKYINNLLDNKDKYEQLISEKDLELEVMKNNLEKNYDITDLNNSLSNDDTEQDFNKILLNSYYENLTNLHKKLVSVDLEKKNLVNITEDINQKIKNYYLLIE